MRRFDVARKSRQVFDLGDHRFALVPVGPVAKIQKALGLDRLSVGGGSSTGTNGTQQNTGASIGKCRTDYVQQQCEQDAEDAEGSRDNHNG